MKEPVDMPAVEDVVFLVGEDNASGIVVKGKMSVAI